MLACSTVIASGQPTPISGQVQMPDMKGKVAQYSLTPHGTVDGLIFTDGTEVNLPPHFSTQLVFMIRPGDMVTIRGVKNGISPTVTALSVANNATGAVLDAKPAESPPQRLDDEGRIKLQLHDLQGHLNGVLLEDGMIVRMPPADAARHVASLAVGQVLFARGDGSSTVLGRVIAAREIGPNRTTLTRIDEPRYWRWMHEVFGEPARPAQQSPSSKRP